MCHPSDSHNSDNYRGLWPSLWLFWKWFLPRPLQLQEILAMLWVGEDASHFVDFLKSPEEAMGSTFCVRTTQRLENRRFLISSLTAATTRSRQAWQDKGKNLERSFKFQAVKRQNLDSRKLFFVISPLPGVNWLWRSANLRSVRRGLWVDKFSYLEHFTIRWNGTFCRRAW